MEEERPNPEDLLDSIQREESRRKKGKLKIFLGAAAGVGKTYAMLEEAQQLKRDGVDVVIGVIDSHGRQETEKLLSNLDIIPLKEIGYKNATFKEMDLDQILIRNPQVVIVDELAHSNVPGSRHPKRWQDVMEILDHGIDVYTTLNVQHIESLKDVVEKIAGILIRETVPDVVVENAAFIELIDIPPDELLVRLKEGKVYLGDQSVIAAKNFFQGDRLTALREIVLRYAAEKVDHDLKGMISTTQRFDAWKPRERLLVAISHSPHSQKLIRITRRLAFNMDAPWIALHVDTGQILNEEDKEMLTKNIALAKDLGAEVVVTTAPDLAQAIQRIARQKSATQIIIGRPPRSWFDFFQSNTLMDRLARECSDIDLHVIRQTMVQRVWPKFRIFKFSEKISSYLTAALTVFILAGVNWYFIDKIGYKVTGFIFLLGILSLSLFYRFGPLLLATFLYAIIWGFIFVPYATTTPKLDREDIILLISYFLTAIFTGFLTDRAKKHKEMLIKREKSIEALYDIVRDIASLPTLEDVIHSVSDKLHSVTGNTCEIITKGIDGELDFTNTLIHNNPKEIATADWVFLNGKEAGWSTSTLPASQNYYLPVKGSREMVGVLVYHPKPDRELTVEEKSFLYSVCHQLGGCVERFLYQEREFQTEQHRQTEKIYESILLLISNLFEGPLLTIEDSLKELKQETTSEKMQKNLDSVENASESLSRILENISAMVNLSAGITPINRERYKLEDLVTNCMETVKKSMENYEWIVSIEDNLPEIYFDYDLIELMFYNLIFHAIEFALPGTKVVVSLKQMGDYEVLSISGEGQSIPPDMVEVSFEKFYREPAITSKGLGLGLAISRAVANVHHGQLKITAKPEGGMVFSLYLPIQ